MLKIKTAFFFALMLLFAVAACSLMESDRTPPRFVLNVSFHDEPGSLEKSAITDLVWVLVADISEYDSASSFQASAAMQNFQNILYGGASPDQQAAMSRDLMKHFIGEQDSVELFSEQELRINMDDSTASGTVSGIAGLNWLIIGFEERGVVNYMGQATATGNAGETAEVPIDVYYVENYQY